MTVKTEPSFEDWLDSRIRSLSVAGINLRIHIVSTQLIRSCGPETEEEIENVERREHQMTRRTLASLMHSVLKVILPKILVSPEWLPQALDRFSDGEIIELYNAIMYGEKTVEYDDIQDIPF